MGYWDFDGDTAKAVSDRERFRRETAARVLAGMVADHTRSATYEQFAEDALKHADALIAKLEKPTEAKP